MKLDRFEPELDAAARRPSAERGSALRVPPPQDAPSRRSLSARLLLFVILVIFGIELAIFVPSVSRYRDSYLEGVMAEAHIAALSLAATPARMVTPALEERLLDLIDAESVVLRLPDGEQLELSRQQSLPPPERFSLDEEGMADGFGHAMDLLLWRTPQLIEIEGTSPREPGAHLTVLLPEVPLTAQLKGFSLRIFGYALLVSTVTGALLFLALRAAVLRDILRLADSMRRFQAAPDAETSLHRPSRRPDDELRQLEQRFADLQRAVRLSLHQKGRLAALGGAVARINHDLRNMLATASLMSERMMSSEDPQVQKLAPRLLDSLDRAVALCQHTLSWSRDSRLPVFLQPVALVPILRAVSEELDALPQAQDDGRGPLLLSVDAPPELAVEADAAALQRALANLARNAVEAGARQLRFIARAEEGAEGSHVRLDVRDDGPGLPPRARDTLFQPFAGSAKPGGTGLGLAIAREVLQAHGGDIRLLSSTGEGTCFRLILPAAEASRAAAEV